MLRNKPFYKFFAYFLLFSLVFQPAQVFAQFQNTTPQLPNFPSINMNMPNFFHVNMVMPSPMVLPTQSVNTVNQPATITSTITPVPTNRPSLSSTTSNDANHPAVSVSPSSVPAGTQVT